MPVALKERDDHLFTDKFSVTLLDVTTPKPHNVGFLCNQVRVLC
jgi:hypothetical protein